MKFRCAILICLACFLSRPVYSQICVDDYFDIDLNTITVQEPSSAIAIPQNEILLAGNAQRYGSLLQHGWLTKLSAQGSVLWTRQYSTTIYNWVAFNKIIPSQNDTYIIAGNIGDADTNSYPIVHLSQFGFLMKVDKNGNLIWSKILSVTYFSHALSDITDILQTDNGDLVLALSYSYAKSSNIIMRLSPEGVIKWSQIINSPASETAYMGNIKLKQLSNGNLMAVNFLRIKDFNLPYQRQGYYVLNFDAQSGAPKSEKFFLKNDTLNYSNKFFSDIVGITEMPDHKISFLTSYGDIDRTYNFRRTQHVLNFTLDAQTDFEKVLSYSGTMPFLFLSAFNEVGNTGDRIFLMDNSDAPFLMYINTDGKIRWQKSYPAIGRGQETRTVIATGFGFYFFSFTHNGGSKFLKLAKTDINGNIPCIEAPSSIVESDVTQFYFQQSAGRQIEPVAVECNVFPVLAVNDYSINASSVCRVACCRDVADTADEVNLCNDTSYKLPNNDVVKNSGAYSIVHKTSKGCDSIVYYKVNFLYSPEVKLGADTCFTAGTDSLVLQATPGYDKYTWNNISLATNTYTIRKPGLYDVSVQNFCGSKSDTVRVFEKCEFEVYMPNAFTPNYDGLNDVFKVPSQIWNRLVRFTIYNRWGEMVFSTKDISKGWDGTYKSDVQPAGVYIYHVEMESIDGKKTIVKKGYVTLLR